MRLSSDEFTQTMSNPPPTDFVAFVPWACCQYQVEAEVSIVKKNPLQESRSMTHKPKQKSMASLGTHGRVGSDVTLKVSQLYSFSGSANKIVISALYKNDAIAQLSFEKCRIIPRGLFKVIALTLKYQPMLQTLVFNSGVDKYAIHELDLMLQNGYISDLYLDSCSIPDCNFDMLLDHNTSMTLLSLSRCNINDECVQRIAAKISHPKPASNKLKLLDLSNNAITDEGAKYLGEALRSNRRLVYLNLSGNRLTDVGAIYILDSLKKFVITPDELKRARLSAMYYYRKKQEIVSCFSNDVSDVNTDKPKKGKLSRKFDNKVFEKERNEARVENLIGVYDDPFGSDKNVVANDISYCLGNNVLASLNLAYNNLGYLSVKELYEVLLYQNTQQRRGLITVSIEGNFMPVTCPELTQIDFLLESTIKMFAIANKTRKMSRKIVLR